MRSETGLGGEALTAFGPSGLEDGASGTGRHTVPETVIAFPAPDLWLESSLHGKPRNDLLGRRKSATTEWKWAYEGYCRLTISVKARPRREKNLMPTAQQCIKSGPGCLGKILVPVADMPFDTRAQRWFSRS